MNNIPVVCSKHIVASLIEYSVKFVAGNVKRHRICARIKVHFVQIGMDEYIGHYAARSRIVFKVVQNPVHLIELALFIFVFDAQLIAVCLAYRTAFVRPTVPDVRMKVVNVVALFLPNP